MSEYIPSFYLRLGIGLEADERAIKRAYSRLLKTLDPELQAAEFEKLRADYEQAIDHVKNPDRPYYFDEGQFIFNGNVLNESSSSEMAETEQQAIRSQDITSVNEEVRSDLDLEFQHELILKPTEYTQSTKPIEQISEVVVLEPSPYELAETNFKEFCHTILNSGPWTEIALQDALREQLAQDTLTELSARIFFENMLIDALSTTYFGQDSGPLLVASAEVLNWNNSNTKTLTDRGAAGYNVLSLLDNFMSLTDIAKKNFLRIAGTPNPKISYQVNPQIELYQTTYPKLSAYFFTPEQINAWKKSEKEAPFSHWLRFQWLKIIGLYKILGYQSSMVIAFCIFIVVMALSVSKSNSPTKSTLACDQAYSSAVDDHWQNMSVERIQSISSCADRVAPKMCADRESMLNLIGIKQELLSHHIYESYASKLQLNLSDGRQYGYSSDSPSLCAEVSTFLQKSYWRAFDQRSAKAMVERLAACEKNFELISPNASTPNTANSNIASSHPIYEYLRVRESVEAKNMRQLLELSDAWPANPTSQGAKLPRISLNKIMEKTDEAAKPAIIKPYKPWVACENDAQKIYESIQFKQEKDISLEERAIVNRQALLSGSAIPGAKAFKSVLSDDTGRESISPTQSVLKQKHVLEAEAAVSAAVEAARAAADAADASAKAKAAANQ